MQVQSISTPLLFQAIASRTNLTAIGGVINATQQFNKASFKPSDFGSNANFNPVFEFTARYVSRDIVEQRDIVETQDVYETRAVHEDQAIYATKVDGNRDMNEFSTLAETGIQRRAKFSVKIGDGPKAVVKFIDAGKIKVTISGTTETFLFDPENGGVRDGLQRALNSVDGLEASYTTDGFLRLEVSEDAAVAPADATIELLNRSKSPLVHLGLAQGTTSAEVIGYEQVQVGTEQVKVGEQSTVVGTEEVKVGTEEVIDGYDRVLVGLERSGRYSLESITDRIFKPDFGYSSADYADLLFSNWTADLWLSPTTGSSSHARAAYAEY